MDHSPHSPAADPDAVSTLSHPQRPAYVLIYSLLGFTTLIVLTVFLLVPEESGLADLVLAFSVIGTTALLCTVLVKASVVHLEASAEEGLAMSMGHVVTRNLPWEAIASIQEAPSGGGFDVGWKLMGGGRIGYLAGAETLLVKIRPEFRQAVRSGAIGIQGSPRLAEWYYVSAPDAGRVAAQLEQLRMRNSPSA